MEDNYIGDKIREIRKKNGLSQEEFAYKVGVAKQTVSSWELGTIKPNFARIKTICETFNVSANDFVDHGNEVSATILESQCIENDNDSKDEIVEEQIQQDEKRPKKYKKLSIIMLIIVTIFAGLSIFLLSITLFTTNKGIDTVQSTHWRIPQAVNIGLFVLLGAVLVGAIVTLICFLSKKRKK